MLIDTLAHTPTLVPDVLRRLLVAHAGEDSVALASQLQGSVLLEWRVS